MVDFAYAMLLIFVGMVAQFYFHRILSRPLCGVCAAKAMPNQTASMMKAWRAAERAEERNQSLEIEIEGLKELLWQLYEGIYGHRHAEHIDPFTTAVRGALELKKAWYERGSPSEVAARQWYEAASPYATPGALKEALCKPCP